MLSAEEILNKKIKEIRSCKDKAKLCAFFENDLNKDMTAWSEDAYEYARNLLNQAMGGPENHYGFQHGKLSQREMFECDVAMFLTRSWEYVVEYDKEQNKLNDYECMKNTQNCENGFGGYHSDYGCTLYPEKYHCIGCKDFKLRQECKDEWKRIKNQ